MKITVIIPVYCVEATLDRCVESVLCQRVNDMEVILVDDGSPDKCPQMCDEWALKDCRIRVIHKENGGLSDARNAALDIAQGDYVTFVDSDDWISPDTYKPLLDLMGDSDLLEYSIAGRLLLPDTTYDNVNDYWLQSKAYTHTYACNKIYKRSLFNNIRYPHGKVFEDVYTLPRLLRHARRITTISQGLYYYCWNSRSITATARGDQLRMLLDAHLTAGLPMDDTCYLHVLNIQMDVCELTGDAPRLAPRRVRVAGSAKQRLKALALNIIGIKGICKVNKFLHHFKQPSRS
jgi:glycosyltransferase involved in cell wall biosynthesis